MKKKLINNGLSATTIKYIVLLFLEIILIVETKTLHTALSEDLSNYSLGPEFIAPVENKTAAIGREVTFSCSVSNIGKYMVGWLRASDKMIISVHTKTVIQNERISVKYEPVDNSRRNSISDARKNDVMIQNLDNTINGTWRLTIRQLKESDRGCYMCQINTSPMISQFGCLDVLVSPDILSNETSTDISVIEGENATLSCKASGRPTPRISWKREDKQPILLRNVSHNSNSFVPVMTYNSSKLHLSRVDRKQMGTYLCIAANDVHPAVSKRVTLSVNFLPNVQPLNQLLGAPLGTDVILECYVEAHPNTVNYWVKEPDDMLLDGFKHSIEEKRDGYKVAMRLTIKQFHENDVGSYSCISSNSLGKVEGMSRLYRIDHVDRHGFVRESHPISILADFDQEFDENLILNGLAEAARGSGTKTTLNINSIFDWFQIHNLIPLLLSILNLFLKR